MYLGLVLSKLPNTVAPLRTAEKLTKPWIFFSLDPIYTKNAEQCKTKKYKRENYNAQPFFQTQIFPRIPLEVGFPSRVPIGFGWKRFLCLLSEKAEIPPLGRKKPAGEKSARSHEKKLLFLFSGEKQLFGLSSRILSLACSFSLSLSLKYRT